jgi:hypothetical protein
MIAAFLVNGLLMMIFGRGLGQAVPHTKAGNAAARLMVLAGGAMMGLAFPTDPTIRDTAATWHGRLHDLAFVLLGLNLFLSMILFGWAFRASPGWRGWNWFTWLTVLMAVPAFAIKGIAFYIFLAAVLVWTMAVAVHLCRIEKKS